ncbi:MAG: mechanosensitive ion channel [Syntrophaceae bacterium]|nr:mechanosensitive ion channel [Syntrophaceae bacterium]
MMVSAGVIGGAFVLGLLVHHLIFKVMQNLARRTQATLDSSLIKHCRGPSKVILPALFIYILLPLVTLSQKYKDMLDQGLVLLLIVSLAWLIIKLPYVAEDIISKRFGKEDRDNLRARKINTQIQIFKKIVGVIVGVITIGAILMTFDKLRHLGTSLLASAGIIGIVVGIAAQHTLGTLAAGLQIAITEPIRIDDVVIVENEWGWIEEINLTYVVVRIWDLRRLILPITYFIQKPFQNWTRLSADLLGTVFLYVDYTVPVQAVREELFRILKNSKLWDGQAWGLQVTNATEHTVELRATVSAANSSDVWDLRCEVRERLVAFVHESFPGGLPKVRAEVAELKAK